jgi:hypothetical protein
MEEQLYKVGAIVPQAGKYVCIICGLIVEYSEYHISNKAVFGICTLCQAGTENGPKKEDEEFWKFLG